MPSWLPSIAYPPAGEGYWSPITSTIDWCEENYYATQYSAEVVNTLTNVMFLTLAFKGIANVIRNGHDQVFLVTFLGYLCVGSGSFIFHATLKYPWQLVDELSMIYTTCLMVHATFTYGRSLALKIGAAILLVSLALFVTIYYHYLQDPTFHQLAYALLTAVVLIRSMYIMEVHLRPSLKQPRKAVAQNGKAHNGAAVDKYTPNGSTSNGSIPNGSAATYSDEKRAREDARDARILKTMWIMVAYGLSIFLGGFFVWNLDNWYCGTLRKWRHEIGLPWGIVLEGHGWWHLMTGVGAYYYITWGIWLRYCVKGQQDEVELLWPSVLTSLPAVVRKRAPAGAEKKSQ